MDTQQVKQQVDKLFREQKYDKIKSLLLSYKDITEHNNDLAMTCYLCTIYEHEKAAGLPTLFSKISDMKELLERYTALKFYLRRIDFGVLDELEIFFQFLMQNKVSSIELLGVIEFSVVQKEKVLQVINGGLKVNPKENDRVGRSSKQNNSICSPLESTYSTIEETAEEICFIICTNDPVYAQECIYYINHLNVPEGIQIDVLTVEKAKSLTSAYNEAMQCSKAKYKVYLHHDTFIINPDFISDCLSIFKNNPEIGMIGNVGCKTIPATGVMWDADRYGMLYEQHIYETKLLANAIDSDLKYLEVDVIDGFIMVTQYDIPWREDLFDKWDFYDCSQSMEFKRRGYKVVVPNMKQSWCVHDCGFINLRDYDKEREKFVKEYL